MKIKTILFALCIAFLFNACEEIGPSVTITKTDRVVLVEEYTGVRCVNCPQGSAELDALLDTYGDNLVAISIHAGIFSSPYPESNYNFQTDDGTALLGYLGSPTGYPAAIINRKQFAGEPNRAMFPANWAGAISSEIANQADVRISLSHNYDETTRELEIKSELYFLEDISGDVNYTLVITEDSIVDVQIDQAGKIPDYVHKHVLRDVITTDYRGDVLGNGISKETLKNLTHTTTLPIEWKAEHCHVVVFVNRNDGGTLDVLQAGQISVTH